jgi:hypothetical protein
MVLEYRDHVRKYLRFTPLAPICGIVRIVRVGKRDVSTGNTTVKILDICQGGLRFVTSLKLPVSNNFVMEICFTIGGDKYNTEGYAVHCINSGVLEYAYGICFLEPYNKLRRSIQKQYSVEAELARKHIFIINSD